MYLNEVNERTLINKLHNTVQARLRETKRYGNVLQRVTMGAITNLRHE